MKVTKKENRKLSLGQLNVQSFVTNIKQDALHDVRGGARRTSGDGPYNTVDESSCITM